MIVLNIYSIFIIGLILSVSLFNKKTSSRDGLVIWVFFLPIMIYLALGG